MDATAHWESVYRLKRPDEVSWFQQVAALSLDLIQSVTDGSATVVDVGGGASTLVDGLLDAGYQRLLVMDLSHAALQHGQRRLGSAASRVAWLSADMLAAPIAAGSVDLWHDRAVFHFITAATHRQRYLTQVRRALRPGGFVVVATFAADGPTRCSGLDVARYSAPQLHGEFGRDFRLVTSRREVHHTPAGAQQGFTYCLCRYEPAGSVPGTYHSGS